MYCYTCHSFNCGHAIGQLANNNGLYPGLANQLSGTTTIGQDPSTWVTSIMAPRLSENVITNNTQKTLPNKKLLLLRSSK